MRQHTRALTRRWARGTAALALCAGMAICTPAAVFAQELAPAGAVKVEPASFRADQVAIEDLLKTCWKEKREEVDLSSYNITRDDFNKILFNIHYENPEYYWVIRYQDTTVDAATGKITTYRPWYTDYVGTPYDRSEQLEREWEIVEMLTEHCVTDAEKALVVHDHLVRTITYSHELGVFTGHDIEGAILEKKCVCEGYAVAFKYYMNRLNIPCKVVVGESRTEPHAWNQVKIAGKWYFVDATWDDIDDRDHSVKHSYFLKSEEVFALDHIWERDNYERCTDTSFDDIAWGLVSRKMTAHGGSIIVPNSTISANTLKTGIWKYDAKDPAAPGTLAIEINDIWQLTPSEKAPGCAEVSYYEGELYYNTPKAVWKWDFSEPARPEKVFELSEDDPSQIWYLHVADGKVYYETARYATDMREQREFVIDKNFQKVKHPIAVTADVLRLKVGGDPRGDFLQAAGPGEMSFASSDPEICAVEPIAGGRSCQLHAKKAGRATITITATGTDHYLPGTKEVTVIVGDGEAPEPPVEKVTVSFSAVGGGSVGAVDSETKEPIFDGSQVNKGTQVLYTAVPNEGYSIKGWTVNGVVYVEQGKPYAGATLNRAVTGSADQVVVEFTKDPEPAPEVDKSKLRAKYDELKGLKAEDYKTMSWHPFAEAMGAAEAVLGKADTAQAEVDEALKALEGTAAELEKVEDVRISDVDEKTDHADDIAWLAANGISKGWGNPDGTVDFRPLENVRRADMAAFLYRLAGEPKVNMAKAPAFKDVDESTPHYDAIMWLASEGISTGFELADGTREFRPHAEIARCDMAAFLYRMAGSPEFDEAAAEGFADVKQGTYHRREILWLASAGVSEGWAEQDGSKTFRPLEQVKRCDMAAFLHRMADKNLVGVK